ncbi:MAG TPA: hypothetical protein VJL84_10890 [Kiloniellales bacterium]|nr:hypothetical protein [Kiloniellales bacterium]
MTAVEGDIVFVRGNSPGHEDERYYRFLVSTKSGDIHYRMDTAKLAALWPLAPGKTVSLWGVAENGGNQLPFDFTVTVGDYESITVPAGAFDTIRVSYTLAVGYGSNLARVESLSWIDVASSLPVRNETTVFAMGGSIDLSMEAKSIE